MTELVGRIFDFICDNSGDPEVYTVSARLLQRDQRQQPDVADGILAGQVVSTERWHPDMNDHQERARRESEGMVLDMLSAIDRRTLRIEVALFGPPEQPWMGHIPTTEVRLAKVEGHIWKAVIGTLVAAIAVVWQWLTTRHLP